MNERFKKLRNTLNLTQQQFADRIGIARGNIGAYEVGKNAPSDAVISLVCREFNVNEEWLRYGTEPMFIEISQEDQLMTWAANALKDESDSFKRRFINMLMALDESDWKVLEKMALELAKKELTH